MYGGRLAADQCGPLCADQEVDQGEHLTAPRPADDHDDMAPVPVGRHEPRLALLGRRRFACGWGCGVDAQVTPTAVES